MNSQPHPFEPPKQNNGVMTTYVAVPEVFAYQAMICEEAQFETNLNELGKMGWRLHDYHPVQVGGSIVAMNAAPQKAIRFVVEKRYVPATN